MGSGELKKVAEDIERGRTKGKSHDILIDMLGTQAKTDLQIMKAIETLGETFVVLMISNAESYSLVQIGLIDVFSLKKDLPGIYITINKPYEVLRDMLSKKKIDCGKIKFIDAISRMVGSETPDKDRCIYVESPGDLTELMVAIEESVKAVEGNKFLVLDSISTLAIYNDTEAVEKLVHALAGKLREWDVKGIFLSIEADEYKNLIGTVSQFCDKVTEIR